MTNIETGGSPDFAAVHGRHPAREKLERLRSRFRQRLKDDLDSLHGLTASPRSDANHEQISSLVHKIAGSAGTFGFGEISRRARSLDLTIDEQAADQSYSEMLDDLLTAIEREIEDSGD